MILFQEKNKARFSTSLCSLLEDRSGLFEDFNQYLSTENNLSPEEIPRIRRRQSIDVSKIESCEQEQTLLMPSLKTTYYTSPPVSTPAATVLTHHNKFVLTNSSSINICRRHVFTY